MSDSHAHSSGVVITNISDRDSIDMILRETRAVGNLQGLPSQNWRYPPYSQSTIEPLSVTRGRTLHHHQEKNVRMRYVKTRTHHVTAPKEVADKESREICAICLAEYEHEETIVTLRCGHEFHEGCIKQWLLRKNDCPICRASVCPSNQE